MGDKLILDNKEKLNIKNGTLDAKDEIIIKNRQEDKEDKKITLNVSVDKIEAFLELSTPNEDEIYSLEEVLEYLKANNINYGIKEEIIKDMIEMKVYYTEVCIARGEKAKNGKNGEYEYFFNVAPPDKPIVLEDGSVDYNTLGVMQLCEENELLIKYTKAEEGINGVNVFGEEIKANKGNELKAITGKGFTILEDETEYRADFQGKIEFKQNKLEIIKLYVVEEDVDATTGNIKFNGDVLVKGNVISNVTIEAVGSITVNGHVEIARLIAGRDVILRNGMQGSMKGYIFAEGDVSAKFFEQTKIEAKGIIRANTILNCNIKSDKEIIVSGKRGAIIGGEARAIDGIKASMIGNRAQRLTKLILGLEPGYREKLILMDNNLIELKCKEEELEKDLSRIIPIIKRNPLSPLSRKIKEIEKSMKEIENERKKILKEKTIILDQKQRGREGCIVVGKGLYISTVVIINGESLVITSICQNVYLRIKSDEIHIYSND